MANCANCGEMNPDTNAYCSKCGQPLVAPSDKSPFDEAFENAQIEFDKDAKVSADKSKLTYICELCGTINKIENGHCSKCGKPRPRSAYIKALNDYKNSTEEAAEILAERAKAEEEAKAKAEAEAEAARIQAEVAKAKAAEEAKAQAEKEAKENGTAVQEPVQEFVEKKDESILRGSRANAPEAVNSPNVAPNASVNGVSAPTGTQTGPVVQPFVIVPYVDSNQKLWQYQPRQVYKFQPYTYEEKDARMQKAMELQRGADPTYDELCRMRDRKNGEINNLNDVIDSKLPVDQRLVTYNAKKEKVRRCSVASLIFSVLLIIATWVFPVFSDAPSFKGLEIFKYIANCLQGAKLLSLPFGASGMAYNGPVCFVLPVAYIIIAVLGIVMAIRSVVRLVGGNSRNRGFVTPLICVILSVVTFVSFMAFPNGTFDKTAILDNVLNVHYGFYAVVALSVVLTIIGGVTPVNPKKIR